jgi:hypothetical protein
MWVGILGDSLLVDCYSLFGSSRVKREKVTREMKWNELDTGLPDRDKVLLHSLVNKTNEDKRIFNNNLKT